jgi:hypothetical protein
MGSLGEVHMGQKLVYRFCEESASTTRVSGAGSELGVKAQVWA